MADDPNQFGPRIRQLQGALKFLVGRQVNFGTGTLTWPGGSKRSGDDTVTHSLAGTPVVAAAFATGGISSGAFGVMTTFSAGATTFKVTAVTDDGSSPAAASTMAYGWIAVG